MNKTQTKTRTLKATTVAPMVVKDTDLSIYEVQVNDKDATLKCALILLQEFCQEMRSPHKLKQIMRDALTRSKDGGVNNADKIFEEITKMVVQERYKNAKNFMLDSMKGFW